ncbi:MAG: PleD family two-component system response regulator [Halothiobacillaceae bacterium]
MAKVVIVDDSPTEVYVLQKMLTEKGFHVESASSAEEGLALIRSGKPDLVLMDVVMPGMNGFQATRQLSRDPETAKIPVIMVTTKDQETDRIWGMRQGAKAYLTKPVNEADLMTALRQVLGG